jgi:hypothetical protein
MNNNNIEIIEDRLTDLRLTESWNSSDSPQEGLSAMQAVAYITGGRHTEYPDCSCPIIGAMVRSWGYWVDDEKRQELVPLLRRIAQSKSTPEVEVTRAYHFLDGLIREVVPNILAEGKEEEWAGKFRALPKLNDETSCRRSRELVSSFADFLATPSTSPAPSSFLSKADWFLDLARARALDLALALALDLALDLARALDLALARARALALARARARARALDRARALPSADLNRLIYNPTLAAISAALDITSDAAPAVAGAAE